MAIGTPEQIFSDLEEEVVPEVIENIDVSSK